MKRIGLRAVVLTMICFAASSWARGEEGANVRNCTWCHGTSGRGFMIAPRLAGQRPQYLVSQLDSFHAHVRDNPFSRQYMWGAVAALRPDAERDLAAYFASLPAKAANDGRGDLAAAGRTIFINGIPEANIVSCLACHGPDAEGVREIPRLGGLSYVYLKRRLEQWGQGYHSTPGSPMPRVATTLSADKIEALASYLSFVK